MAVAATLRRWFPPAEITAGGFGTVMLLASLPCFSDAAAGRFCGRNTDTHGGGRGWGLARYHLAMQSSMMCMRLCHTPIIFSTAFS